LLARVRVPRYS